MLTFFSALQRKALQDDERLIDDSKYHTLGYTTEITIGRYPPSRQPSQGLTVWQRPSVWANCEHRDCSQPAHLQPSSTQKRTLSQGSNTHPSPSKRPCDHQTPVPRPGLRHEVSFKDSVSTHSASTLIDSRSSEPRPPSRPFPRTMRRSTAGQHHKPMVARQLSFIPGQQDHILPKRPSTAPPLSSKHCQCCKNKQPAPPLDNQYLKSPNDNVEAQEHTTPPGKADVAKEDTSLVTSNNPQESFLYAMGKAIFTLFGITLIFSNIWKALTYTPPPVSSISHKECAPCMTEQRPPLNGIFREVGNFVFLLFGLTVILGVLRSRTG